MADPEEIVIPCSAGKTNLQNSIDAKRDLPAVAELEAALDSIRPFLNSHMGDVAINGVDGNGRVKLAFTGACTGCPNQAVTFAAVVLPALKRVPGVVDVDSGVRYSDAVIRRISSMYGPRLGRVEKRDSQAG